MDTFEQKQQAQLATLANELSRLNAQFEDQKRLAGVSEADLEPIDPATLSPELRAHMDAATEAAKRAGEARRTQAEMAAAPTTSRPGAARRGVIRM